MRRVTLTQYLIEQQRHYGKVSPELRLLIEVRALQFHRVLEIRRRQEQSHPPLGDRIVGLRDRGEDGIGGRLRGRCQARRFCDAQEGPSITGQPTDP